MALIFNSLLVEVAVAVATCLLAVYLYFTNAYRYWKRRGVHYEEPSLLFGNMGSVLLQKEQIGVCYKRVYDSNHGQPVVGLFGGSNPLLLVRDLDLVRNILVKDAGSFLDRTRQPSEKGDPLFAKSLFNLTGNRWRHMRMKLTPTFTSGKIKNMFYLINECGRQLVPCIEREMSKGKCVVKETVARYSTDVIASCAFGLNANSLEDPNSEFRTVMRKMLQRNKSQRVAAVLYYFAPWVVRLLGLSVFNNSANSYLRKTFWDVAEFRKNNKVVRKDFVDILMQLKREGEVRVDDEKELEEIKQDSKFTGMKDIKSEKRDIKLEDDDYVAQAFIFIAAGYETSSSVISFTLFELALHPAIQDKLRREIQTVLNKHNSEVTYDAIAEMPYLEMVVSETMRRYPTLTALDRKCLSEYKVPGTGITIEKGTNVIIPVLAIHMDPAIYPEPEKFDPERFSPVNRNKLPNFAHMPFGEGPRICIGMRFGQMQVKTALVHILTSFKVKPCADTPQPPLGLKAGSSLNLPNKDIVLAFEKIK